MIRRSFALPPLLLGAGCGGAAQAETTSIKCQADAAAGWQVPAMTLVYEGGDTGTLTVKSAFGEMALQASKVTREQVGDDGKTQNLTGFHASGPAKVLMPDKAAAEACTKGRLKPEDAQDAATVSTTLFTCLGTAPIGTEPIDIKGNG